MRFPTLLTRAFLPSALLLLTGCAGKNFDEGPKTSVPPQIYAGGVGISESLEKIDPGYWKNGTWVGLTQLAPARNSSAVSLVVSGADVYAGGYNTDSANAGVPGYWKNGTWVGLTPLDATRDSGVFSLVVSGSDVYAGGYSSDSSGVSVPG